MDQNDPYAPYGATNRPVRPLSEKEKEVIGNVVAFAVTGLAVWGGVKLVSAVVKSFR